MKVQRETIKISAILVAYRDPGYIEENVKKLKDKVFEIVVAADKPNSELLKIIKKYRLKATISAKRRGKWKALNDAISIANGDYLLFIDSDTRIIDIGNLEDSDVVEIRKEISCSSVLEKLVNIDYFNMLLSSKIASKLNSCLGLNGAAFGIKKDILLKLGKFRPYLAEDIDLGMRLGLNGYKIKISGKAITKAPSNLREWLSQRERWSAGGSEVVLDNFAYILKKPKIWIPSLILLYPAIIGFLINLLLPDSAILKIFYFILPFIPFLSSKFLILALLTIFELHIIRNLISILISFIAWASVVVAISKKVKYPLQLRVLPAYYFLYSPLWMIVSVVAFVKVLIYRLRNKKVKIEDWVV